MVDLQILTVIPDEIPVWLFSHAMAGKKQSKKVMAPSA